MTPPRRAAPAVFLLVLVAAATWIPFPRTPGLVEEWSYLLAFDRGQPWIAPDVLSSMPTRPFLPLVYGVASWLTPDSFVGLHLLHLVIFLGEGLVAAAIAGRTKPGDPAFAALVGALVVVFPADRSLFLTRDTSHHAAVLALLLSLRLLFRLADRPGAGTPVAIAACQAFALGSYESGYPFLLAAPLALAISPPAPPLSRPARARLLAVWYAIPLLFGAATLVVLARGGSYVTGLLAGAPESPLARVFGTARALVRALGRHFAGGWADAAAAVPGSSPGSLAAAGLAAAGAALVFAARRPAGRDGRLALRLAAAGVAALILGALPFLVAPALRDETRRTFLLSSFGAAFALSAVAVFFRDRFRGGRAAAAAFAAALVFLAVAAARAERRIVDDVALREAGILRGLATAMPSPATGLLVLYLDAEGPARSEELFGLTLTDVHLADALRVVTRRPDLSLLVFGRPLRFRWNGRPEAGPDGMTVSFADGRRALHAWERIVAFREEPDGRVTLLSSLPAGLFPYPGASRYAPGPLLGAGPPPPRLATLVP